MTSGENNGRSAFAATARVLLGAFVILASREVSAREVAAREVTELEVKAAFLYHFTYLVEWPPSANATEPLVIGVVANEALATALENVIGQEMSRKRPIKIVRARTYEGLGVRPHVLAIGADTTMDAQRALQSVRNQPVLTVGESDQFAEAGGMIGFRVTPEGRVTFDINLERTGEAGLKVSSQLLKIARIVKTAR
jgi:YfiR/HmsC-like